MTGNPEEDLLDLMDIPDHQESNVDLAAYTENEKPPDSPTRKPDQTGPCHACSAPAKTRCIRCERPACTSHHHVMYGLCTRCAQSDPAQDEASQPPDLDIPWVE